MKLYGKGRRCGIQEKGACLVYCLRTILEILSSMQPTVSGRFDMSGWVHLNLWVSYCCSCKDVARVPGSYILQEFHVFSSVSYHLWHFFGTAINGRPKPEICFLPGRLKWTLLPEERYNALSSRGSNTQPSSWEANTLPLYYRRPCETSKIVQSEYNEIFICCDLCSWGCLTSRKQNLKRHLKWIATTFILLPFSMKTWN